MVGSTYIGLVERNVVDKLRSFHINSGYSSSFAFWANTKLTIQLVNERMSRIKLKIQSFSSLLPRCLHCSRTSYPIPKPTTLETQTLQSSRELTYFLQPLYWQSVGTNLPPLPKKRSWKNKNKCEDKMSKEVALMFVNLATYIQSCVSFHHHLVKKCSTSILCPTEILHRSCQYMAWCETDGCSWMILLTLVIVLPLKVAFVILETEPELVRIMSPLVVIFSTRSPSISRLPPATLNIASLILAVAIFPSELCGWTTIPENDQMRMSDGGP